MTWTQKTKSIPISNIVPHAAVLPQLIGRAPAISNFDFTPLELFGAAARCSHMQWLDPTLVTMESTIFSSMIAPHVDDHSDPFFFLPTADNLKDFMKSSFAGSVAQGLAYLAMTRDNYSWADHFENLVKGATAGGRSPDFVFGGYGQGVALMESKGTRSASPRSFDATVRDGYIGQVEPHLGTSIGGLLATHGFCIGASLHSSVDADLIVHHTAVPAQPGGEDSDGPEGLGTVQRGNFATAFALAHSGNVGAAIRSGDERGAVRGGRRLPDYIPFLRFHWRGRHWLTSWMLRSFSVPGGRFMPLFDELIQYPEYRYRRLRGQLRGFAIEERVALQTLKTYLADDSIRPGREPVLDIPTFHDERRGFADEGNDGAIFADGLAILGKNSGIGELKPVVWDRRKRDFV